MKSKAIELLNNYKDAGREIKVHTVLTETMAYPQTLTEFINNPNIDIIDIWRERKAIQVFYVEKIGD